ncbi:isoprenylcysteine carboxylmethyltransferase family protein, partial [archaeon]
MIALFTAVILLSFYSLRGSALMLRARPTFLTPLQLHKPQSALRSSENGNKPFSDVQSWKGIAQKVKKQASGMVKKLFNKEARALVVSELKDRVKVTFTYASKSIKDGEFGKRGEVWFAAQLTMLALVIFGVPSMIALLIKLGGVASIVASLYFLIGGVLELGQSLSPFPLPSNDNQLVTTGVYAIVRHPMYCGLILLCLGVSIYTDSATRLVATLVLALVLVSISSPRMIIILAIIVVVCLESKGKRGRRILAHDPSAGKFLVFFF